MFDVKKVRDQFPAIYNHPDVIYFDNATTSQKPQVVLDAVSDYHNTFCSSPHRSAHDWGVRTTKMVEETRQMVSTLMKLRSSQALFFNSGATEGSFQIALHFMKHFLDDANEVVVSQDEHQSVVSQWQKAADLTKKSISFIPIALADDGDYQIGDLEKKITARTKVVLLTHVHNVFGLEMAIPEARTIIPPEIPIVLDATQSLGHVPLEPENLGVQAVYFSTHKMFSFSGLGAIWLDKSLHAGCMSFEAGTPNIEGLVSFQAALRFITEMGMTNIQSQLLDLTQYALGLLRQVPGVEFLPGPAFCRCATGHGILSFRLHGLASDDVAAWLNEHRIYVRAGSHCSSSEQATDSVRLSFQIYNTRLEIDRMVKVLREI